MGRPTRKTNGPSCASPSRPTCSAIKSGSPNPIPKPRRRRRSTKPLGFIASAQITKPRVSRALLHAQESRGGSRMIRRNYRMRREYLYTKSLEGAERALFEKKRRIRQALEEGKPIRPSPPSSATRSTSCGGRSTSRTRSVRVSCLSPNLPHLFRSSEWNAVFLPVCLQGDLQSSVSG